jgi:hypothetical protein
VNNYFFFKRIAFIKELNIYSNLPISQSLFEDFRRSMVALSEFLGSYGLTNNQFFSAGFALSGLAVAFRALRGVSRTGVILARNMLISTLEIPSKDRSFHHLMEWVSKRKGYKLNNLMVETKYIQQENGEVITRVQYVPSSGMHFFAYKGRLIRLDRERSTETVDITSGNPWEIVRLTMIGRSPKIFHELIADSTTEAMRRDEVGIVFFLLKILRGTQLYMLQVELNGEDLDFHVKSKKTKLFDLKILGDHCIQLFWMKIKQIK